MCMNKKSSVTLGAKRNLRLHLPRNLGFLRRGFGVLVGLACILTLTGCPIEILLPEPPTPTINNATVPDVTGGGEVPATIPTLLTIEGTDFQGEMVVRFSLDAQVPLIMTDDAPAWMLALAESVNEEEEEEEGTTLFGGGSSVNNDVTTPWHQGTLGEYIIGPEGVTVAADGQSLTVMTPVLEGLALPAMVYVVVAAPGEEASEPFSVTYNPPPTIKKITALGELNEQQLIDSDGDGNPDAYTPPTFNFSDGTPLVISYAVVPSQVSSPVAVDGWNIEDGALAQWVLEGVPLGDPVALVNGGFLDTPVLPQMDGPARVGLEVTNTDGQTDLLDLAILCTAPPTLLQVVRQDAVAAALPYPENEVPATVPAMLTLCGKNIRTDCGYVKYTDPDGNEIGRASLLGNGGDEGDVDRDLNSSREIYDGIQCIQDVPTPIKDDLTAPMDIVVSLHFPDGQYTEDIATKAVGTITLIPPAQLTAAAPPSVPMTLVEDDESQLITLTGTYIHPGSDVKVRWAYLGSNDGATPADDWIGDIGDLEGFIPGDVNVDRTELIFPRPPLAEGLGSSDNPVAAAKAALTNRLTEDRDVAFVVRDGFGQESEVFVPEPPVTYAAPPVIYDLQVTGTVAPERTEQWLLTGKNWDVGAEFTFERADNGAPLTLTSAPTAVQFGANGVQSITAGTPILDNPTPGLDIPVLVTVTNPLPDGQSAVAAMIYEVPNAPSLVAYNSDTGYPEVGAEAAAPTAPAVGLGGIAGRNVTVENFTGTAAMVSFVDANGDLIGDPVNGDNPVVVAGVSPVMVAAPVLDGITEPTPVYVKVTKADGQETPDSQLAVIMYKPAPTITNVATEGYGNPVDTTSFPAEQRGVAPLVRDCKFTVTGDYLTPSEPARLDEPRAFLSFTAYLGAAGPGQPGYQGTDTLTADVFFTEAGEGFGITPVGWAAPGVTDDHLLPAMSFYDLYGQEAAVATPLNVVAGPVVQMVEGVFTTHDGVTTTSVADTAPGRGGIGTPEFRITGRNLASVAEVVFRSPTYTPGSPSDLLLSTPVTAAGFTNQTATSLSGPLPQMSSATMPDTLNDVEIRVTGSDGQTVLAPNPMVLTAPPRITEIRAGGGLVLSKSFIANTTTTQTFQLVGEQMQYGADATGFTVAFQEAGMVVVSTASNPTTAQFDLRRQAGNDYIVDKLGELPFTYTNYMGQTAEVPDINPQPYIPLEDHTLVAARGPVMPGAPGTPFDTLAVAALCVADLDANDAIENVIAVSIGQYYDNDDPLQPLVDTLKIDVWKRTADTETTLNDAPSTVLFQASAVNPGYVQFMGDMAATNWPVAIGHFVGNDLLLDLAVGVADDPATPAVDEACVCIFTGIADGFAPVSATNPIKLEAIVAEPLQPADSGFGAALAAASVTAPGANNLLVGAPRNDLPGADGIYGTLDDIVDTGAVFVYTGPDLTVASVPVDTLRLPDNVYAVPELDGANGVDNDGDGVADDGPADAAGMPETNGLDDDLDGVPDDGILSAYGVPEVNTTNGTDDDGDNVIDDGPTDPAGMPEADVNGADDDGDGVADDGPFSAWGTPEMNGADDDGDGVADDGPADAAGMPEADPTNGADDDLDGVADDSAYPGAELGTTLAAGDLTGDNVDEILIGAPNVGLGTLYLTSGTTALVDGTSSSWRVEGAGIDAKVCSYNGDGVQDLIVSDGANLFLIPDVGTPLPATPANGTRSVLSIPGEGLFVANSIGQIVHIADVSGAPQATLIEDYAAANFYLDPASSAPNLLYAGSEPFGSYLNTANGYGSDLVGGNLIGCPATRDDKTDFAVGSSSPRSLVLVTRDGEM